MQAAAFVEPEMIGLREKPVPEGDPFDALLGITTTTSRGTGAHIMKGAYPVAAGLMRHRADRDRSALSRRRFAWLRATWRGARSAARPSTAGAACDQCDSVSRLAMSRSA
jgi:hypothetical protein